jgi:integrase
VKGGKEMGVFKRWIKNKDGTKTAYWYIRYMVNGKEKWESVGKVGLVTKAMAQIILEERKREIRLGKIDMIPIKPPTLAEFSEEYIQYQRDVKQKRSWEKDAQHLRRFNALWGNKKLSEIRAKDIDDYKIQRLREVKPATVNRELEVLRHLFYLAKRWKLFYGENPVSESGLLQVNNQIERILTIEEQERLINASADHLKPIIWTALCTGMRKTEILTLQWKDVDFENNTITIHQAVAKSKKIRKIPISNKLRKILFEQKLKTGFSDYVFLTPEGKPYSPSNPNALKRAFGMACKRAGIQGLRFHDLRHTFASRSLEGGANIVAVSKILGHAELKTTMRYVHPDSSLRDAVEKASSFDQDRSNFRSNKEEGK